MTAILGYISSNLDTNPQVLLASDGLVIWHTSTGNQLERNYQKINRFQQFLISFNGEVLFYEMFLESLRQITDQKESIPELIDAINNIFPFGRFGNNLGGNSQSKYSNIIILDIRNRVLAHHYAGDVSSDRGFNQPFIFEVLTENTLYEFGSVVSFINYADNGNRAFFTDPNVNLASPFEDLINNIRDHFAERDDTMTGVGNLNSFYIIENNGREHSVGINVILPIDIQ